ncbi:carboxypeptidase-like regulatory domain-containing protein [Deinococcus aquatilis]|uniref:carboxypeptidase-like regulatory domain-containing protein n=1 Tax=Deinococcus aquatilis TaxID=519440 RepID=UPI000399C87C|nr:carboxypeptidase-like regulatory domain-containing protein [Deinococcus aquatilis]
MNYPGILALTVLTLLLSACGGASDPPAPTPPSPTQPTPTPPSGQPGTLRPYHMVGVVKNSLGKPLAGVRVGADNTYFDGTEVWTVTDAQGRYDLNLEGTMGAWTAVAHLNVNYHGQAITLTPEVDNAAAFGGVDGAVRNFTLKITGKSPGGGYYGALVYGLLGLSVDGDMPEFGDVEYTLTPDGPLIDGTAGDPFVLKWSQLPFEVPQGRYTVTARSISDKGPIWVRPRGGTYGSSASLDVEYTPGSGMTISFEVVQPRL